MARGSDGSDRYGIDRRAFLGGAAALLLHPRLLWADAAGSLPEATQQALEASSFVYVSPLRSDGAESTCHGEVWYGWIDGAVVLNTSKTTWKALALNRGLDRARLWVGDYGRWKGVLASRNDGFRKGPSFDARAERVADAAVNDRLLALYDRKYPGEIGKWRDKMRDGFASGDRIAIRYRPI